MNRSFLAATLLLLTVLMPLSLAMAEDQDTRMRQYLHFSVGGYFPDSDKSSVELGYGISPSPYSTFEANFGYLQDTFSSSTFNRQNQPRLLGFVVMAVSVTGVAKAVYPFGLGNIYALAGGGAYYSMFHFNGDRATAEFLTPSGIVSFPTADDDIALGYFFGGGGEIYAMKNYTIGIEAKWLELHPSFDKVRNSSIVYLSEPDLSYLQTMFKITYNF